MKTRTLARPALALVVLALCASDVFAGPVRDFIRENRPGLIVPKRSAPSCGSCQSAPAPVAPAPISDPDLGVSPSPNASGVILRPVCAGGCPNGSCVAPQIAPPAVTQAGALVTTSGRTLLPNGDGTYRYADDRPTFLPSYSAPSGCPGGVCPAPSGLRYVR